MKQPRLVCLCNHVTANEIIGILKTGPVTVADIQRLTAAGTTCGRCLNEIGTLLVKHPPKVSRDAQLKIIFD